MRIETMLLPVRLTDTEQRERGAAMASLVEERERILGQAKLAATEAKGRAEAAYEEIGRLARIVRTGVEYRDVETREEQVIDARRVDVYRVDTGEVVGSRPMSAQEVEDALQVALFPGDSEPATPTRRRRKAPGANTEASATEPGPDVQ